MPIVAATPEAIADAAQLVRAGGLVAMPTETVYGLAADATNGRAVAAIYATKGRPSFNPLIVHVASIDAARALAHIPPHAETLARTFWPGALTLVLEARPSNAIASLVTAGLATLAIRVPAHPVARALIAATGRPLAAPSANRSGRISPTTAAHVAEDFAADSLLILDGGACAHGLESTILACNADGTLTLLRPGAIASDAISAATGMRLTIPQSNPNIPTAPGQLASHYAPRAGVRLDAVIVHPGEALLAFGPKPLATSGPVINLSPTADLIEAAHNLFAALRTLDATGVSAIAVMPIPATGLGIAICDRLARAAAVRS